MNAPVRMNAGTAAERPARLLDRSPERLVLTGFRCWMAGYEHGSIDCWEVAWNEYARELGSSAARQLFGDMQYWVRTIRDTTHRTITCFPYCCKCVCRDECMALSIISALQTGQRELAHLAAYHLTEAPHNTLVASVAEAGQEFAAGLLATGHRLIEVTPGVVDGIANHEVDHRRGTQAVH